LTYTQARGIFAGHKLLDQSPEISSYLAIAVFLQLFTAGVGN